MSQIERLYQLKSYLDAGRCLTRSFLLEDLAHLRNGMGASIIFDRERRGGNGRCGCRQRHKVVPWFERISQYPTCP